MRLEHDVAPQGHTAVSCRSSTGSGIVGALSLLAWGMVSWFSPQLCKRSLESVKQLMWTSKSQPSSATQQSEAVAWELQLADMVADTSVAWLPHCTPPYLYFFCSCAWGWLSPRDGSCTVLQPYSTMCVTLSGIVETALLVSQSVDVD
eukprot:GHUV01033886.1.p1 GENE.GHUV01033886.1~~GHUV01033886.1.p1  ORF type:complete len:148 (-),score=15.52 GHUV01033886.1:1036-1479(-)